VEKHMKSEKIIVITEIGPNHNGNFGLFFKLIKQAAWSLREIISKQHCPNKYPFLRNYFD